MCIQNDNGNDIDIQSENVNNEWPRQGREGRMNLGNEHDKDTDNEHKIEKVSENYIIPGM